MTKNNGGPAFPSRHGSGAPAYVGMSLRDYFAGQALLGVMLHRYQYWNHVTPWFVDMAKEAYQAADVMLEVRESSHDD